MTGLYYCSVEFVSDWSIEICRFRLRLSRSRVDLSSSYLWPRHRNLSCSCSSFAALHSLVFNASKTQLIRFSRTSESPSTCFFFDGGTSSIFAAQLNTLGTSFASIWHWRYCACEEGSYSLVKPIACSILSLAATLLLRQSFSPAFACLYMGQLYGLLPLL